MEINQQIIAALANTSPITDQDEALYNEFFKTEGKKYRWHYSRNWIFIKQIANGRGIKYFDKEKRHLITIAPNWGGDTPNYIFLPLGVEAIQSVPNVAEQLGKVLDKQVIAKKIYGEENKNFLLKSGFQEVTTMGNTDFEHLDDDKYPEVICDVDSILQAAFGLPTKIKMESFKRHIRKAHREIYADNWRIQETTFSKELERSFKELIDTWSLDSAKRTVKQFQKTPSVENVQKWMADVYYPHFIEEYADKVDGENVIAYLTFINDQPAGFTSAYPISDICLGVNASIADTNYPGLIQYLFFRLAGRAKFLGYKYLNLGSNDTEAQYRYKSSMGKVNEIFPYILEYQRK